MTGRLPKISLVNPVRTRLAEVMDLTVRNRGNWHYIQQRPSGATVTLEQAEHGTVWTDCSAGYAIVCRLAGAPNPLHAGAFDGYGNSHSAWEHLPHIKSVGGLQVGDCVIYGDEGSHHIACVREPAGDPLLWSMGSEAGPEYVRYRTEVAWQPKPVTFARLLPPDPEPTPLPVVDPFWVWLRWRLGEGEFRDHGCDPNVRPDVPRLVPPAWWLRARRFIAARHHDS